MEARRACDTGAFCSHNGNPKHPALGFAYGRTMVHKRKIIVRIAASAAAFDTRDKNYVFTRSLLRSPVPPGVELVNEPIKGFATRLRQKKGQDIWMMCGAGIIASFLDEGEIDEVPQAVKITYGRHSAAWILSPRMERAFARRNAVQLGLIVSFVALRLGHASQGRDALESAPPTSRRILAR
jgi:hypothetical protein